MLDRRRAMGFSPRRPGSGTGGGPEGGGGRRAGARTRGLGFRGRTPRPDGHDAGPSSARVRRRRSRRRIAEGSVQVGVARPPAQRHGAGPRAGRHGATASGSSSVHGRNGRIAGALGREDVTPLPGRGPRHVRAPTVPSRRLRWVMSTVASTSRKNSDAAVATSVSVLGGRLAQRLEQDVVVDPGQFEDAHALGHRRPAQLVAAAQRGLLPAGQVLQERDPVVTRAGSSSAGHRAGMRRDRPGAVASADDPAVEVLQPLLQVERGRRGCRWTCRGTPWRRRRRAGCRR